MIFCRVVNNACEHIISLNYYYVNFTKNRFIPNTAILTFSPTKIAHAYEFASMRTVPSYKVNLFVGCSLITQVRSSKLYHVDNFGN